MRRHWSYLSILKLENEASSSNLRHCTEVHKSWEITGICPGRPLEWWKIPGGRNWTEVSSGEYIGGRKERGQWARGAVASARLQTGDGPSVLPAQLLQVQGISGAYLCLGVGPVTPPDLRQGLQKSSPSLPPKAFVSNPLPPRRETAATGTAVHLGFPARVQFCPGAGPPGW